MRVLLVDDEPRLVSAVRRSLERAGIATTVAADGPSGHRLAGQDDFDVLILDLMLPGMSGYELCRRLRAEGNRTPVLVLSAKDGEHDEADALDLGADDYLRKPFATVVLLARIHALARRGSSGTTAEVIVGDLVLHEGRRQVLRCGQPLDLTPREFALLHELMRFPGRTRSRAELLDSVWGVDGLGRDLNLVEVYVGYLRRKLAAAAPAGAGQPLQTVRGHGYRLEPATPATPATPAAAGRHDGAG